MTLDIPLSSPDIGEQEIDAVVEVLRSGQLSLGPRLPEFERVMAEYVGVPHAVAVSSGTAALHLALVGLGIGEGDEVITSSFSFIASANAILSVGAQPVFVDIDPDTLNFDPAAIEARITPRTRAILVVHVFGRPVDMVAILAIAQQHQLKVVEDACEALGAEVADGRVGSLGDAGVFGFYPNKVITTAEGGVLVTSRQELAEQARRLRNQGRDGAQDWFEHVEFGYNYRLSDLACALGIVQLRRIEEFLVARARVAQGYHHRLFDHPGLVLPAPDCPGGRISWFAYVIRLAPEFGRAERDALAQGLIALGIGCGRYFAPIHLQPVYRERGFLPGSLPLTESAGDRCLALPFHNRLGAAEVDRVCDAVCALLGHSA